tara:strand:- start:399 stop:575 length:177 start_codon:yes stop_codon:yes gene_type:complete
MGLFAFRRAKEREAAVTAAASVSKKPAIKKSTVKADGSNDHSNGRQRKRKQLLDAGGS